MNDEAARQGRPAKLSTPASLAALADAQARIVSIRDALEDGDVAYAVALAGNLEYDLAATLAREQERAA